MASLATRPVLQQLDRNLEGALDVSWLLPKAPYLDATRQHARRATKRDDASGRDEAANDSHHLSNSRFRLALEDVMSRHRQGGSVALQSIPPNPPPHQNTPPPCPAPVREKKSMKEFQGPSQSHNRRHLFSSIAFHCAPSSVLNTVISFFMLLLMRFHVNCTDHHRDISHSIPLSSHYEKMRMILPKTQSKVIHSGISPFPAQPALLSHNVKFEIVFFAHDFAYLTAAARPVLWGPSPRSQSESLVSLSFIPLLGGSFMSDMNLHRFDREPTYASNIKAGIVPLCHRLQRTVLVENTLIFAQYIPISAHDRLLMIYSMNSCLALRISPNPRHRCHNDHHPIQPVPSFHPKVTILYQAMPSYFIAGAIRRDETRRTISGCSRLGFGSRRALSKSPSPADHAFFMHPGAERLLSPALLSVKSQNGVAVMLFSTSCKRLLLQYTASPVGEGGRNSRTSIYS
ncbi:uncharacterized protein CLUP02_12639 [Colletotrichum lupini]|uniref:Uncharacterized protein n=1 Tax=Colletotrichum lupini TaxID=145971 RepID=A0A9Q8T1G5_9PEZI|nr:uncharacterized protein CLUP02_12639 [Colletotrichum lupini]UQC87138.1 hypothetical protein CLUP02_12639 [Colletotrichum lupini]